MNHINLKSKPYIQQQKSVLLLCVFVSLWLISSSQKQDFLPAHPAKPWVFWYWMQASVSKAGITADLEAMKANGIDGAYLMPIKGVTNPPLFQPPVEQLSPLFWDMVKFAMQEADRLGLQMGMHFSDGFAIGGGPWITPALSMQKVVWKDTILEGGRDYNLVLPQPESYKGYYKNIAVLAYPTPSGSEQSTYSIIPTITTSKGVNARFLVNRNNKESFRSDDSCWIQYAFNSSFTCRTIKIRTNSNNYQAQRLMVQVSDDGIHFHSIGRLQSPRHGWQDTDADVTNTINPVTAKYFRFVYDKTGSEPGSEDLDAAKWKPTLKISGIELSGKPQVNQFEGKNGEIWRVSEPTTRAQLADSLCVPLKSIIDLTSKVNRNGHFVWAVPAGKWTILNIGFTSTGHTNATGGGGIGLECDKFNPEAVKLQFTSWFGESVKKIGPALAARVLKVFHVDSWECGSQNWSPVFRAEFQKRRGYDVLNYLPVMAGVPVQSAAVSERFLYDIRQTITELLQDNFFETVKDLSHTMGRTFTAESVAPTMTSDGLLHYSKADVPMGEFWLNSPTHDKPNDMLDAISGAHIYGKPIIQAEAFTTLKMAWNEHPGMLKILQDRNYALGINRLVYHVFMHNPWMDRKPGMTLDGVGLYFQRDQTWWKAGKAWIDYAERCQVLLQKGKPVVDVAVFTGEEIPRRALLPDRLLQTLPGVFGKEKVQKENQRLVNHNEPLTESPQGVWHAANMTTPADWIDPLQGYQYDSFNPDVLLNLAKVKNGRIVLPGGASYGILVVPGRNPMNPDVTRMSLPVASRLLQLVKEGATVLIDEKPDHTPGLANYTTNEDGLHKVIDSLWSGKNTPGTMNEYAVGKGKLIVGVYTDSDFKSVGIPKDVIVTNEGTGQPANDIAWTHRKDSLGNIYFISNQQNEKRTVLVSLRSAGYLAELYDAVTGQTNVALNWQLVNGRTQLLLVLEPAQSVFVLLQKPTSLTSGKSLLPVADSRLELAFKNPWEVHFDKDFGGPATPVLFDSLTDWSKHKDTAIQYYSGTAIYTNSLNCSFAVKKDQKIWLDLGRVANMATVKLNGIDCGTTWTFPYHVDITHALQNGENDLEISVTNTWSNRLIGDTHLPVQNRITNTTAPIHLEGKPLQEAGLLGPVAITLSSY